MSRSVTTIGCPTAGWDEEYFVSDPAHQMMARHPQIARQLESKLRDHGRKMPKVITASRPHYTVVWRKRSRGVIQGIVITTACLPDGRLMTRITHEKVPDR